MLSSLRLPQLAQLKIRLNERYGHLPWYRRFEFLLPVLFATIVVAVFALPEAGRPSSFPEIAAIATVLLGTAFFTLSVVSDREKPILLKRVSSLGFLALCAVLFVVYSGTEWARVQSQFFNLERMQGVWPLYLNGLIFTFRLSVIAAALSMALGLTLGILRSLRNPFLELFLGLYIDVFRSLPLIVNMVIVFYALPFLGIDLSAFWAATTSLVLMNSAYQAEIFRAGIESIPKRQVEAARALGLGPYKTLRLVVLPQSFRIILPPLSNNLISLVKDTAVAYVITVPELLTRARQAVVWKRNPTPIIFSMFIYIGTLLPLIHLTRRYEQRSKKWAK